MLGVPEPGQHLSTIKPAYMTDRFRISTRIAPTILLTLCCALLVGCGRQASSDRPSELSISFMVFGDPHEQDAFESVIESYHATAPQVDGIDVRVEMIAMPSKSDYLTRLTTDFAAGEPPDVFLLNYRRLAQYHNRGALDPLGPRIASSETIREADYFPVALDAFRDSSGTLVCMPQNISSQVVYYNQEIFDKAELPYPAENWTWADFRQTAIALTLPDSDGDGDPDQYGLGLEPHLVRMAPFIWQNGGALVDNEAAPSRMTIDSPTAQDAIQFVLDLAQEDGVIPSRTAEAVQSQRQRFYAGSIAMYIDSRRIVPTMRAAADFEWDVAPLPRGEQIAGILHSDGYCMSKAQDNDDPVTQDAAWSFIEFAMSVEGQKPASRLGRTVPSLIEVANSDVFLDPSQPPASSEVWLDAVPHLRMLPRLENWARIERTAAIEFEQAYLGLTTLPDVVDHIQAESVDEFNPLK
jgi:multiple sugar transport system substrate-binding protein